MITILISAGIGAVVGLVIAGLILLIRKAMEASD